MLKRDLQSILQSFDYFFFTYINLIGGDICLK